MLLYVFYAVLMLRYSYTVRWICREKELVDDITIMAEGLFNRMYTNRYHVLCIVSWAMDTID